MTTLTKRELVRLHELTVSQIAAFIRYLDVLPLDAGLTDAEIQKRDHQRKTAQESLQSLKPISAKLSALIRVTRDGEPFVGSKEWLPTPENVNALPEPIRRYIHHLETNADPAGTIREGIVAKENAAALEKQLAEARAEERRVVLGELAGMIDLFETSDNETVREGTTACVMLRMYALLIEGAALHRMTDEECIEWIEKLKLNVDPTDHVQ